MLGKNVFGMPLMLPGPSRLCWLTARDWTGPLQVRGQFGAEEPVACSIWSGRPVFFCVFSAPFLREISARDFAQSSPVEARVVATIGEQDGPPAAVMVSWVWTGGQPQAIQRLCLLLQLWPRKQTEINR